MNGVSVPVDLELTHPIVLKTQRSLARSKRDANALVMVPSGALHIHTSRELHDRALRIMQALLTAFELRGFAAAGTAEGVRVTILDEPLGFGIEERTKNHAIDKAEVQLARLADQNRVAV